MGYIYKITNNINGHMYIGQTRQEVWARWNDHCKSALNPKDKDYSTSPLHVAIRKYGRENFSLSIIEKCPNEILNEREKYWIATYNTYLDRNHYNASLGGEGNAKYDYSAIVEYYLANNNSITKTTDHFKIYDQVVYTALKNHEIAYKNSSTQSSRTKYHKLIVLVEEKLIFNSMKDVEKYFGGKNVHGNVRRCLRGNTKRAYGFTWIEIYPEEESNYYDMGYQRFASES